MFRQVKVHLPMGSSFPLPPPSQDGIWQEGQALLLLAIKTSTHRVLLGWALPWGLVWCLDNNYVKGELVFFVLCHEWHAQLLLVGYLWVGDICLLID